MLMFVCFLPILQRWANFLHMLSNHMQRLTSLPSPGRTQGASHMVREGILSIVLVEWPTEFRWASWKDPLVRHPQKFVGRPPDGV